MGETSAVLSNNAKIFKYAKSTPEANESALVRRGLGE
jgi:hypothetical protein